MGKNLVNRQKILKNLNLEKFRNLEELWEKFRNWKKNKNLRKVLKAGKNLEIWTKLGKNQKFENQFETQKNIGNLEKKIGNLKKLENIREKNWKV